MTLTVTAIIAGFTVFLLGYKLDQLIHNSQERKDLLQDIANNLDNIARAVDLIEATASQHSPNVVEPDPFIMDRIERMKKNDKEEKR